MTLRWFGSIAAAAALAVAAFAAIPDIPSGRRRAEGASRECRDGGQGETRRSRWKPSARSIRRPRSALVMEVETGTVLLDKNADERIPPASMSKLMTAYVVFDYLKQGRAKLDDELPVSERAWRTGGSKMFVPLGERGSRFPI